MATCDEIGRAINNIRAGLEAQGIQAPKKLPSSKVRIKEMLCGDLEMPQGYDAYHRMSGVAHSQPTTIFSAWNLQGRRPSIDYYDFLVYPHLALCAIDFSLGRRAACWGESRKNRRLLKVIGRMEFIIAGEPDVVWEWPLVDRPPKSP